MASNMSAIGAGQFLEERLVAGLVTGSFPQSKELLDMLEDVDFRYPQQKTLLHVGVGLGKADWVEELLARGADPRLVDGSQRNALSSAEEMARHFPDDVDRSLVLKLVSLVHRRDQVMLGRLETSSSRSTDHITAIASPGCEIESLKSSVDALREEMISVVCQLRSSLEELKGQVCGCDALLHRLEEAVTLTAEGVASIKVGLGGDCVVSPPGSNAAKARQECVDAMMHRTRIVYGSGAEIMRRLYETLYDEDDCTACIIKFLSGDDRVKVMVDCDSWNIGMMKDKVVTLDGTLGSGSELFSFCDFGSETVYLGINVSSGYNETFVCARLVGALSQLSLKLVFGNEGRPYSKGEAKCEREWMRALEELEERRKKGVGLHNWIHDALDNGTQLAKVCCIAATVPEIITYYGSTEGRGTLQQQAYLFSLYCNYVMRTLQAKR